MTYQKVISYLDSFIDYEKLQGYPYNSFKLDRFKKFLNTIDNPQRDLKVIHVAGSKGKGSVCAFIAYILREAGYMVGLYTSPHLIDFRERIRILGNKVTIPQCHKINNEFEGMISKQEINNLVTRIKPKIDKFNKTSQYGALTFFEAYTALAFQYFRGKKVDFVILETGLGGRLDATNTCNSILSIITPISLEHTKLLGKSLKEIACEKSSIIKNENKKIVDGKILALTSKQNQCVRSIIKKFAKKYNSLLLKEGKNFKFSMHNGNFNYRGLDSEVKNLRINLLGKHQIANASLAIAATQSLKYHNINIKEQAIRKGLWNCRWPARFEIISKNPTIILDGAQNAASVQALRKAVKQKFPNKKIWLIFGIARDKELKDTCKEVSKITKNIILTKVNNPRASEPRDLRKYFGKNQIILSGNSKEGLKLAKDNTRKQDLILVTGSLYLCAEIRSFII